MQPLIFKNKNTKMKKLFLPFVALGNLLLAQTVVINQPVSSMPLDYVSSYSYNPSQKGIFTADDFELTSISTIKKITIFGKGDSNFLSSLQGFTVHLIPEQNSLPMGIPFKTYTGGYFSLAYPTNSKLVITDLGNDVFKVELNNIDTYGICQNKPIGKYWLSVAGLVNANSNFFAQANWYSFSSSQNSFNNAVFVDPDDLTFSANTTWKPISTQVSNMNSLAFIIETADNLGTKEIKNTPDFFISNDKNLLTITELIGNNFKECEIFDMSGKKLGQYKNKIIDISYLNSSIYVLKVVNKNGKFNTFKFKK